MTINHDLPRLDLVAIRPKLQTLMKTIVALLAGSLLLQITSHAADKKPVFLYSRYFNAKGENRYLPDGTYKDVLGRLEKDFEVRVNDKPLTAENLKDVNVVLVANPSANCAKSFVTREGIQDREKQVVAPKVTVTVPADGKWHEYAD